jgi:exodeoxyribonuclease V alpha subunit
MGIITDITEGGIFVFVNGHNVFVEDKLLKLTTEIDLGYCITVHKMQGSECKRVVIFLEKGNSFDEGVSMLYTAITRARESVHLYYY